MQKDEFTLKKLMSSMRMGAQDSKTFEKLAYYLEKNYQQVVFFTAEQLANQVGVSQGTVSKFCQTIGFRGFSEFQQNLQRYVSETITAPQRLSFTSKSNYQSDELLMKEAENIVSLKEITHQKSHERLVDAIIEAEELVLISARLSATLLYYLEYLLSKLRNHTRIVMPESNDWQMLGMQEKDKIKIIAIGFPRYPNVLLSKLEELKKKDFEIYCITDSQISPIAMFSDDTVFIPLTVSSIFDMYSAPMAYIALLLRDVSKKMPNLKQRLDAIEQYDTQHNVYYHKR